MKLVLAQYKASVLSLARNSGYFIGSIIFPALFFLFFAPFGVRNTAEANFVMGSFMIFAAMGALFFGFAVGIAQDRASAWAVYERTLPGSPLSRLVSRVMNGFTFATCAVAVMAVVAHLTTPAHLPPLAWSRLALALVAGAIPISLLGFAIGYFASPRGAGTLAQLLYLPMSFVGGLWVPPQHLPEVVQKLSPFTPTRHWGEVVWPAVTGGAWRAQDFLWLGAFTLVFGLLALWGYHRDEGQRFS
ncbi:ABC transporter permease [Calidithermus timidus]|jgi:ABC-2 type transport system permease protein|uniref:ABC transporter permease n=1 Tax=Calidithermus timidus TaxID=307124 RepID=UPI000369EDE5|nr:ABC transporter permease [Calidithermus timidus]